jgi:hypothetical protein
MKWVDYSRDAANTRLERTRHERSSLLSYVGEPLNRSVGASEVRVPAAFMPVGTAPRSDGGELWT